MKYLLLVCWDAERMNGQAEPEPGAAAGDDVEGFPWLDDLQARGIWLTGDQLAPPRRARSVRVRGERSWSRTARSRRRRKRSAGST